MSTKKKILCSQSQIETLRERAEKILQSRPEVFKSSAAADIKDIIHELQTYEIELEMQNEELETSRQEIEELKDKYLFLYDSAPCGYLTLDVKGVIEEVNLTAAQMFLADKRELIGKPLSVFLEKDSLQNFLGYIQRLLKKGEAETCEIMLKRSDKVAFFVRLESRVVVAEEGMPPRIAVLMIDIADRKKVEDVLRESTARLNLALESASMGAWSWDIREDKRYFDGHTCRILGIDPQAFTGKAEEFFRVLHPDDVEKVKNALARTIESNVPYEPEYRVIWSDGSVHCVAARARLIRDGQGRAKLVTGILWDITQRKKVESELAEKFVQVEKYNKLMMGREVRIIELKKEVDEALAAAKKPLKYRI